MEAGATIVTFGRTLDAFAFEDAARSSGLPGRLIPLPTAIAASCGLAWKLPPGTGLPADAPPRQGVYRHVHDGYERLDA